MKKIKSPLNLRSGAEPVILSYIDNNGVPIIDKGIHLISLGEARKSKLQMTYYGEMKPFSFRALENTRYSELANHVYDNMGIGDLSVQSLRVEESREPLILQETDTNDYSIIFFGRKRKQFSKDSVKIVYVGNNLLLPFNEENKEFNRDFLDIVSFLDKRERQKTQKKIRRAA